MRKRNERDPALDSRDGAWCAREKNRRKAQGIAAQHSQYFCQMERNGKEKNIRGADSTATVLKSARSRDWERDQSSTKSACVSTSNKVMGIKNPSRLSNDRRSCPQLPMKNAAVLKRQRVSKPTGCNKYEWDGMVSSSFSTPAQSAWARDGGHRKQTAASLGRSDHVCRK